MDETYRLEDHFCPGCLSARHDLCDGGNYWCECWCLDDHPALRDGPALRLPGMRLPLPPEGS